MKTAISGDDTLSAFTSLYRYEYPGKQALLTVERVAPEPYGRAGSGSESRRVGCGDGLANVDVGLQRQSSIIPGIRAAEAKIRWRDVVPLAWWDFL